MSLPKLPDSYIWFSKLGLLTFVPWHIDPLEEIADNHHFDERFRTEGPPGREVITFATRQDRDDFAGFEIINGEVQENVIVFHPTFHGYDPDWNIIQEEYPNMFAFLRECVLPEMEDWIPHDSVDDYLDE